MTERSTMADMKQQLNTYKMFFGLIFQAAGGGLDGHSPTEWANAVSLPEAYALAAVIQLREDYVL